MVSKNALNGLIALILSFVMLCMLSIACEDDKIIDPPVDPPPKEVKYNLYVSNQTATSCKCVFVIDPDSNVVVNQFEFDYHPWTLTPSSDGSRLFVGTRFGGVNWPGKLYVVDLRTGQVMPIFDGVGDVFEGVDGQYYVIIHEAYQLVRQIGVIDTLTYEIAIFDTLDMDDPSSQGVAVHPTESILYGKTESSNQLFAYDYIQKQLVKVYDRTVSVSMIISHDGRYMYIAAGPVYDLIEEQSVGFVGGYTTARLGLSPDGQFLYVTDPGGYGLPPEPSGKVFVYDTSLLSYVAEIDVDAFIQRNQTITENIAVSDDGATGYVTNYGLYTFVLDLENHVVQDTISFRGIAERVSHVKMGIRLESPE